VAVEFPCSLKYLDPEAEAIGVPRNAYESDAGMDLHCILKPEDREHGLTILPGTKVKLPTGIAIALPHTHWARITHRSSTEAKLHLRVVDGTIDGGYRGALYVQVNNPNTWPVTVHHKSRIAQLICHRIHRPVWQVVDELPNSDRGTSGFGSSGR
jgi:dUTP pyrophosphatase